MKRQRGRSRNSNNSKPQNPNRAMESNGPGVKVRGAVATIHEKYQQLARDAALASDPVMAENYLQFAEHYFRIMREQQLEREKRDEEQNAQRAARQAEYDARKAQQQAQHQAQQQSQQQQAQQQSTPNAEQSSPRNGNGRTVNEGQNDRQNTASVVPKNTDGDSAKGEAMPKPAAPRRRRPPAAPPANAGTGPMDIVTPVASVEPETEKPARTPRRRVRRPAAEEQNTPDVAKAGE